MWQQSYQNCSNFITVISNIMIDLVNTVCITHRWPLSRFMND